MFGWIRRWRRDVVENTGDAVESDGGVANTGLRGRPGRRAVVRNTGDAVASGPRSRANTGIDYSGEDA